MQVYCAKRCTKGEMKDAESKSMRKAKPATHREASREGLS